MHTYTCWQWHVTAQSARTLPQAVQTTQRSRVTSIVSRKETVCIVIVCTAVITTTIFLWRLHSACRLQAEDTLGSWKCAWFLSHGPYCVYASIGWTSLHPEFCYIHAGISGHTSVPCVMPTAMNFTRWSHCLHSGHFSMTQIFPATYCNSSTTQ